MEGQRPNFEDDRITFWKHPPKGESADEIKEDPTSLSIDVDTEEVFESRVYPLQATQETAILVFRMARMALAEQNLSESDPDFKKVIERGDEMLANGEFKFLAKRRKADGRITHVLLFHSPGWRCLVGRTDWDTEKDYRSAVTRFEVGFLERGLVFEPTVATLEEWQRYAEKIGPPEAGKGNPLTRLGRHLQTIWSRHRLP